MPTADKGITFEGINFNNCIMGISKLDYVTFDGCAFNGTNFRNIATGINTLNIRNANIDNPVSFPVAYIKPNNACAAATPGTYLDVAATTNGSGTGMKLKAIVDSTTTNVSIQITDVGSGYVATDTINLTVQTGLTVMTANIILNAADLVESYNGITLNGSCQFIGDNILLNSNTSQQNNINITQLERANMVGGSGVNHEGIKFDNVDITDLLFNANADMSTVSFAGAIISQNGGASYSGKLTLPSKLPLGYKSTTVGGKQILVGKDIHYSSKTSGLLIMPIMRGAVDVDISNSTFTNIDLTGVNFGGCNLTNVDFKSSDLNNVVFDRATITNLKLANVIRTSNERFRGRNMVGNPTSLPTTVIASSANANKYNYTHMNNKFISVKVGL